jgi:hypothetical protein
MTQEHVEDPPAGSADATTETTPPVEAPAATDDARTLPRGATAVAGAVAAGLVVAIAGSAMMARKRGTAPHLHPGERLAISVRPRKVLHRYVTTLGLWELQRRAMRFSVTDRRLLIEKGLFNRVAQALPLDSIGHVALETGPWEGWIEISAPALKAPTHLGPMRSTVAQRFAAAIARGSSHLDEDDIAT